MELRWSQHRNALGKPGVGGGLLPRCYSKYNLLKWSFFMLEIQHTHTHTCEITSIWCDQCLAGMSMRLVQCCSDYGHRGKLWECFFSFRNRTLRTFPEQQEASKAVHMFLFFSNNSSGLSLLKHREFSFEFSCSRWSKSPVLVLNKELSFIKIPLILLEQPWRSMSSGFSQNGLEDVRHIHYRQLYKLKVTVI